ncbi:MAG: PQQ-like beta-propeller repeat protein [Vicinamibacteria bacterium]|nr:PQQ-like beta-propeller repeat protein [Vicinamibacteria bacterium]
MSGGLLAAGALAAIALGSGADVKAAGPGFWPQWRGPVFTGEAPGAKPPTTWSETRNVRFKVALPGSGKSTPIVWGDALYLTSAVPAGAELEFTVLSLARKDGATRWSQVVRRETPHEGTHKDGSFAGGSALTDGQRVYAFFGSRGLYALDLTGKVLWEKQLGQMRTRMAFGEGASPALHAGTLVVNWDHEGDDFVAAFDAATGQEKWRQRRDEPTSWVTPLVVTVGGKAQVVVPGTHKVVAYALDTGALVWEAPGLTANVIPTPVSAGDWLYVMSGFRGNALRAIQLSAAKGAITGPPTIAWSYDQDTPYVPSPLLYQGGLYFLKSNSGILTRLDAATGTASFTQRLEGVPNVYASPVAADGRVYVAGRDGATAVLKAGAAFEVLALNRLDDGFDASPAIAEGDLFLRGAKHLYRIAEK